MYLYPAMRIVQLTDLHIGLPDEATFEADVRGNLPSFTQNKARTIAGNKALEDIRKATGAAHGR